MPSPPTENTIRDHIYQPQITLLKATIISYHSNVPLFHPFSFVWGNILIICFLLYFAIVFHFLFTSLKSSSK